MTHVNSTLISGCVQEYSYKNDDVVGLCSSNLAYKLTICKYTLGPTYGFCVRSLLTYKVTHHINNLGSLDNSWGMKDIGMLRLNLFDTSGITMMMYAWHNDAQRYITFHKSGAYKYSISDQGELRYHSDSNPIVVSGDSTTPNRCTVSTTPPNTIVTSGSSSHCYWSTRIEAMTFIPIPITTLGSANCVTSRESRLLRTIIGDVEDSYQTIKYQSTSTEKLYWVRTNQVNAKYGYIGDLEISSFDSITYKVSYLSQGDPLQLNPQSITYVNDETSISQETKEVYVKANVSTNVMIYKDVTTCTRIINGQITYLYPDFLDTLFNGVIDNLNVIRSISYEEVE
jgi:hypothetical protein